MKMKEMTKNNRSKLKFFAVLLVCMIVQGQGVFAASSVDSASVLEKYNQGIKFQADENYYTASQYYLEVVAQNPAFTDAWYKLAECSYKLGEFDLALQYLESAEKYEKNNLQIQNLKVKIKERIITSLDMVINLIHLLITVIVMKIYI